MENVTYDAQGCNIQWRKIVRKTCNLLRDTGLLGIVCFEGHPFNDRVKSLEVYLEHVENILRVWGIDGELLILAIV